MNTLEDLLFGFLVAAKGFNLLLGVAVSADGEILQRLLVKLLLDDLLQDLIVEESQLPVILMETLWEVFEVACSQ